MSRRLVSLPLRQLSCFAGLDGVKNAEDFLPIAKQAVKKSEALISRIHQVPVGSEVIQILDEISDSVCRVADVANFCYCNHPSENWRRCSVHALQYLVHYIGTLNTNQQLFCSLKSSLENREHSQTWTAEMSVVGDSLYRDFVSCGMGSGNSEEIQGYITSEHSLGMQFQRCAAEHNEIRPLSLDDPFLLPGHLQRECTKHHGRYHLPMTPSNYLGISHYVQEESVRKAAYVAHFQSLTNNVVTLNELLKARKQWATALGWETFGHFKLQDSVALDPESVTHFLMEMANQVKPGADEEIKMLSKLKGETIFQWDISYYTTLKRRHAMDAYGSKIFLEFDLQSVINGLSRILLECMDIEMIQLKTDELWDSSVQYFAFHQASGGQLIGHLYMDLLGRKYKRPENAHYTLRCGRLLENGQYQTPIVALVTTFTSRKIGFFELRALLHEFGHVLHSLLSKTQFQHLFGTRGPLDLVEIPSHFFETLAYSPEALQYLAGVDQKSHLPISLQSLKHLIEVNQLFSQIRLQEQLQIALADQYLHGKEFQDERFTTTDVMQKVASEIGSVPFVPDTYKEAWLTHLTTYGARYYSYLFSRLIARIAWERIGADLFNKSKWEAITQHLFQPGGAMNPQEYVFQLIGKDRLIRQKQGWIPIE